MSEQMNEWKEWASMYLPIAMRKSNCCGEKSTPVPANQWITPRTYNTLFKNDSNWLCFLLQCLVTCGKGHKHRQVWCQFGEDRLNDRICDPETKPASMQTCQQPECASWQAGPWGQVFWMIKFLTTFFLLIWRGLAEEHSSGLGLTAVSCGLRYTSMAPGQAQETLQPFCPASEGCGLPCWNWLFPLQTHVHVFALGLEL